MLARKHSSASLTPADLMHYAYKAASYIHMQMLLLMHTVKE